MSAYVVGVVAVVVALLLRKSKSNAKQRGVPVDCGGEQGYAIRNAKCPIPLESAWEGVSTLAELFESGCKLHSDKRLLGTRNLISKEVGVTEDGRTFEKLHLGGYEWLTYAMVFEKVCNFASGLARIGHSRGENVVIFADTRAEWFIAMQACFRRNVTIVTVYSSLGEEALCQSLNETDATTVICGSKELKKLVGLSGQLDTVKRVICMDDEIPSSASSVARWTIISFSNLEKLGQENPVEADLPLKSDIAIIMYTSGSSGTPKGVMMSHANILATISSFMTIIPGLDNKGVYLAYLPLAHILEIMAENMAVGVGSAIGYGSPLTLTDTSNKIKRGTKGDVTALRPTIMLAVPAILDRVRDGVRKKVDAKGGLSKRLFDFAYTRRLAAVNGSWFGAWGLEMLVWNLLVFSKIRAVLGGRIRYLISGGAPLSSDTQRFINICLGVPVKQGYGLTESCGGGTASEVDDSSVGRVGNPLPCSYVKLIDWPEGGYLTSDSSMPRGEIVIGGPNVAVGYFKNEEKTKEVFKVDERGMRWCCTGDIGQIHADGCLEIIDRKKDIVKLQHGEYVSLGKVETALIASPYVDNLMVHADPFQSYCVAVVVGAQPALQEWASKQGISFTDFADLCAKNETIKEVQASLFNEAKKARLEKFEIPAKIKLLHDPWAPESGLVTASLKIKRESIRKAFAQQLNKLYES